MEEESNANSSKQEVALITVFSCSVCVFSSMKASGLGGVLLELVCVFLWQWNKLLLKHTVYW